MACPRFQCSDLFHGGQFRTLPARGQQIRKPDRWLHVWASDFEAPSCRLATEKVHILHTKQNVQLGIGDLIFVLSKQKSEQNLTLSNLGRFPRKRREKNKMKKKHCFTLQPPLFEKRTAWQKYFRENIFFAFYVPEKNGQSFEMPGINKEVSQISNYCMKYRDFILKTC